MSSNVHHVEIAFAEHWNIKELLHQFPDLRKWDTRLILEVRSANHDSACLQAISPMLLVYEGGLEADFSNATSEHHSQTQRFWKTLLNQRRFFLSISPLLLVFLLTEWLFLAGTQSFTSVLAFAGVLGNSLVGGIFPVLLLISSRRKGELVPGVVFKILNHPLFSVGVYSLFLAILLVHGLFIWENSVARISALSIAVLSLGATLVMKYYGAFTSRVVVELRQHQGGQSVFTITAGGQPKIAEVLLGYAEGEQHHQAATVEIPSLSSLKYATFRLPTERKQELRVWAHKSNSLIDSKSLPAFVEIQSGNKNMHFDLMLSSGRVLLPLINDGCWLKFTFPEPSFSGR